MNGERLGLDGERPENGKPKRRKPNRTPPSAAGPGLKVTLLPHEIRGLSPHYPHGGGGLQGLVNWILDNTDPVTGVCFFPPDKLERAIRYIHPDYGPGGPQSRLRGYLTPGLRRAGVDPLPPRAAR
jgi:hypothetical protein